MNALVTGSCLTLCDPTMVAHEAPLSMRFSRPSPGDLPDPGIEPGSPTPQADSLPCEPLAIGKQ